MDINFIAITSEGAAKAVMLTEKIGGVWHGLADRCGTHKPDVTFTNTADHIRDLYLAGKPIAGFCAAGILIRAVSGHLHDKFDEPPLIAISDDGKNIIPLLGGHHGGNKWAKAIADMFGATAAITTAGDGRFGIALDEPPAIFAVVDPAAAKKIMARLLAGAGAMLSDNLPPALSHISEQWHQWIKPIADSSNESAAVDRVKITLSLAPEPQADLVFCPKILTLGLGAARHCPSDEMQEIIAKGCRASGVHPAAIRGIYSVDVKADETAIHDASKALGLTPQFFTAQRLEAMTPHLLNPSEVVFAEVGCHGVAEAAALAATSKDGRLIQPKIKTSNATMAIAMDSDAAFRPDDCQKQGRVMLIGIGPGQAIWRTPEATRMIAEADELVGYGFYIDLLGALATGKVRRDFALGEEEKRCRYAITEAAKGKAVAIICSGDAGIYAMGALVYELLASDDEKGRPESRIAIETAPGISAMQAAAARSGAILGHDFCAISLSDLLTPWAQIERRITGAAEADFVIAFYNPVSKKRRQGLLIAREILLAHRADDTPVILASNLGRADENIRTLTLGELSPDNVDMLTTVMVGATTTKRTKQGVFTPRGYSKKMNQNKDET